MINGTARISFTQLKTQVHGDLEVLGDITASNIVSLTAPAGSGITVSGNEAKVSHDSANTIGFSDALYVNGWASDTHRFDAYYTYPTGHTGFKCDTIGSTIEFAVDGQTALINVLRWSNGGYIDVHGLESATGQYMFLQRLDTFQNGGLQFTYGTAQHPNSYHHAGCIFTVLATNLQPAYSRIRLTLHKVRFWLFLFLGVTTTSVNLLHPSFTAIAPTATRHR